MNKLPFVYLTSTPFSGSTLFSFLANSHPSLATVGELTGLVNWTDPDAYLCSCGLQIRACPFWNSVGSRMTQRGYSFDPSSFETRLVVGTGRVSSRIFSGSLGNTTIENVRDHALRLFPSHYGRLRYLIARYKALAASILELTGTSVFLDASKSADTIRHFSRELDIDFRVVHLVRDVRGFSCSRRKNKGEVNLPKIVNKWARANSNIERQLRRIPSNRWIRIRYEDICASPLETLDRFFEFCGLSPLNRTTVDIPQEHHIVGNRMRLGHFGVVRLDESWRKLLSVSEQVQIARLAGEMHVRYGYKPMTPADLWKASA